jgi:dTDP-4-dehydrorhamnose reductase
LIDGRIAPSSIDPNNESSAIKASVVSIRSTMTRSTLLFGATSILGYNLARQFPETILPFVTPGNRVRPVGKWPALNLEDPDWPAALFRQYQPDLLLYCHAVCDVPKCEAAPDWARDINIEHVRRVMAALPAKTRMIYVSSDHVFGGDGVYDEQSSPCPISVYGQTRVAAEALVLSRKGSLVIRVGLPIGASANGRSGHWDWLRYRIRRKLPITIVHDEYRSAVWVNDLAARVMRLVESTETGIRHVSATRVVSRVELANYLLSLLGESADYQCESRHQRAAPHLGRVELASVYQDELSQPLPSVIGSLSAFGVDPVCVVQ